MYSESSDPILTTAAVLDEQAVSVPKLPPEAHVSVVGLLAPEGAPAPEPTPRYQEEIELGRGGMGRVVSVFDRDLNRRVAMKTLADASRVSRRFVDEAQVSAQLEHPNVLPVYDFGVDPDGSLYFTMKHVEGHETLRDVITRLRDDGDARGRYTFEHRVQIVQQVCHALAYAHDRGVSHRDIKPENILLGPRGEVYLADWGIAALKAAAASVDGSASDGGAGKTSSGTRFAGTLSYMSPERMAGSAPDFDVAGDVYSLCAVLYELLTLHHYVPGGPVRDRDEMFSRVTKGPYVDAKLRSDPRYGAVPVAVSHVCRLGLSKNPAERFPTAMALHDALQLWLEGRAPVVCPRTAIQRGLCGANHFLNRHRLLGPALFILAALTCLAALAFSLITLIRR